MYNWTKTRFREIVRTKISNEPNYNEKQTKINGENCSLITEKLIIDYNSSSNYLRLITGNLKLTFHSNDLHLAPVNWRGLKVKLIQKRWHRKNHELVEGEGETRGSHLTNANTLLKGRTSRIHHTGLNLVSIGLCFN